MGREQRPSAQNLVEASHELRFKNSRTINGICLRFCPVPAVNLLFFFFGLSSDLIYRKWHDLSTTLVVPGFISVVTSPEVLPESN